LGDYVPIAEKLSEMAASMKQKESESISALKSAADAEMELTSAKKRYVNTFRQGA
jgi:hypothetical protein